MESAADPRKTAHSGHEGHGVHLCGRCGWPFPNAHPSSRHRRAHKRLCGSVEGYIFGADSGSSLSHSHSLNSAVSSFSDDGSDGDSKGPGPKIVISKSVNEGGSGRVLERMNRSEDDIFADAVAEFPDANTSLINEDLLEVANELVSKADPGLTPAEGFIQALDNPETVAGITTCDDHELVTSSSDTLARSEISTDARQADKKNNAVETQAGLETGLTRNKDNEDLIAAPIIVSAVRDASITNEVVPELEETYRHATVIDNDVSRDEVEQNAKPGPELSGKVTNVAYSGGDKSEMKVKDLSEINAEEPGTESSAGLSSGSSDYKKFVDEPLVSENSDIITDANPGPELSVDNLSIKVITDDKVESISEVEENTSCNLVADESGAPATDAGIQETLQSSTILRDIPGAFDDDSTKENDLYSLSLDLDNIDNGGMLAPDKDGQFNSTEGYDITISDDALMERGLAAEDRVIEGGQKVSEGETDAHETEETKEYAAADLENAELFTLNDLSANTDATPEDFTKSISELDGPVKRTVELLHVEKAPEFTLDINSPVGDSIRNETSREVKLDQADASDPATNLKPESHDVLLQKLEEDLSDDEPIDSSQTTEASSPSLGNNLVVNGEVPCKETPSKDVESSQQESEADPEKDKPIAVPDAPYEISSPNGSSLDGNWGSVSVMSTLSDAAADIKKTKDATEGQSLDESELLDPPSFLTLVEPQDQKAATASTATGEVQNTQQSDAAKVAWFPSVTNIANDSHGRKKNEEIIAKVTNWSAGKQQSPLKTLLGDAKASSPTSSTPSALPKDDSPLKKNGVTTVNTILGTQEPEPRTDKLQTSTKELDSSASYRDEIKREKRKAKGKPYWVPFMCCSSVK